jgi:hypothetical protein
MIRRWEISSTRQQRERVTALGDSTSSMTEEGTIRLA